MSIFDIALERRFTASDEATLLTLSDADTLLVRDSATGVFLRLPYSVLVAAISSGFSGTFASLVDGKVPAAQLPAYVDDVLEYTTASAFPAPGEAGKIYIALDTNRTYRWGGSAYVEISQSLALGETASTAYRGDQGKTAYDHSQSTGNPHGTSKADVGLGNADNTSDANKPVSTAQQTALDLKANKALPALTTPTLSNSWVDFGGGFQTAGYYKDEFEMVHLSGLVKSGTIGAAIFTLPAGFRPAADMQFPVASYGYGSCLVTPSGSVLAFAGSNTWYSLDGICFRAA